MEQKVKQASEGMSFKDFVLRENKVYCLTILGLTLLLFIGFKQLYPFPDFFSDSYAYISAAIHHMDVNIWPIGYSKFLRLFDWFTRSGSALVYFQYLAFALSGLFFYLTVTYFYPTGRMTRSLLCLFLFFDPLFLYVANYVTSDILFISMSTLWLSLLIWILQRPNIWQVVMQALLMFIMFTFRYNAMIYPIIAAGVLLASKQKVWVRTFGILLGPVLIIPFILWSSYAAKIMTGTAQFPPILGGWQWGNNALYMRGFIEEDSTSFPTPQTAELDRIARKFFGSVRRPQDDLADYVANYFIRQGDAPLKVYLDKHYHGVAYTETVADWGKAATVFDQYGKFLIRRHPAAFARYYLLVNAKNYFVPPLEKLKIYNTGKNEIWVTGQYWFHYPTRQLWCISHTLQGRVLAIFPWFFLILNLYYFISLLSFIRRCGLTSTPRTVQFTLLAILVFVVMNAVFSIFANIIVIRYQIFPMLVFLTFSMLQMDYVEMFSVKTAGNSRTTPLTSL